MSVTLDEILMLAGRLDDNSSFDSPRERFRRFLIEHAGDPPVIRALIEQSQHLLGEQHHRALQDLVVVLGRSLGFETGFGTYLPVAGTLRYDGQWRSRGRLDIVLEIRTDQMQAADLDSLSRDVAALAATSQTRMAGRTIGLCVITPLYLGRARLEELAASEKTTVPIRIVSLRSLLSLAEMVASGALRHDDVVRLLENRPSLDFIAELLERFLRAPVAPVPSQDITSALPEALPEPAFWLATVTGDYAVTPERFVEVVIGKRRIFGVSGPDGAELAKPADVICFYIAGRGAVGRAVVASIDEKGTGLRDADQYRQLLHLDRVELWVSSPLVPPYETQLRLRAARGASGATWQPFMRISRDDFLALTGNDRNEEPEVGASERGEAAESAGVALSAGDSQLRG